jgi:hypothetical protein
VYSRTLDGEVLTIRASGWIYESLFVLYDDESGSLWYELPGTAVLRCIAGEHYGKELPQLESSYIEWDDWFSMHPTTKVLPSR